MLRILLVGLFCLPFWAWANNLSALLVEAAIERTSHRVAYNGEYRRIAYPGGDVPDNLGVCTDLVIRAYRQLGVDLQQRVHEDMRANFSAYPSKRIWGLTKPDTHIDHRRVPNLQRFFTRKGQALTISNKPADYQPGDLVSWLLPGNLPHIGIVIGKRAVSDPRPMIVHNVGHGPEIADVLFAYKITGHYRYLPIAP